MADQSAIYTQDIKRAHDPFSGNYMDMYGVWEASTGRVIAYCSKSQDAERIKALLVYYGDQFPEAEANYGHDTDD